jgi:hypothetical protein
VLDGCLEAHGGDAWAPAIDQYRRLRKPNCDVVTELSPPLPRAVERVGSAARAREEARAARTGATGPLHPLHPRGFTHMPYADALAASTRSARALDEIPPHARPRSR